MSEIRDVPLATRFTIRAVSRRVEMGRGMFDAAESTELRQHPVKDLMPVRGPGTPQPSLPLIHSPSLTRMMASPAALSPARASGFFQGPLTRGRLLRKASPDGLPSRAPATVAAKPAKGAPKKGGGGGGGSGASTSAKAPPKFKVWR